MTTLPTTLAMIATSITATTAFASNADFNNDGNVNASDLLVITSNIGLACDSECTTDLSGNGVVDSADIIILMQQWGSVEGFTTPATAPVETTESSTSNRNPNRDMSWQGQDPILLDAVYYDDLARSQARQNLAEDLKQGEQTKTWASSNNVAVLPMSINGAVDYYEDGVIDEADKDKFRLWMDANVPADYDGPLCLDLEGQWWSVLDSSSQAVMDTAIDFYIEGLEYAQSLRPNAKIGYWGIPKKSHSKANSTTASIDRLLQAQTGLFPDVYEYNPGGNDANRLEERVEKCMQMVNGEIPVYAVTFPRYSNGSDLSEFHTQAEFQRDQVQSTLDAVWTDANGKDHRVNGVALWDAYVFVAMYTEGWSEMTNEARKALWNDVDSFHVECLKDMKSCVETACAQAASRREVAQQEQADAQAAADQAAAETAAALEAQRQQQRSQLLATLNSSKQRFVSKKRSYRKQARSYRSSRKSWSKAKTTFAKAKRQYKRGSKQYKKALAQYKKSRQNVQRQARSFQKKRNAYRSARANWSNSKNQWQTANVNWAQQEQLQQTLLASM
jgi:hypothetical protein